ncbi:MAG: carboxypeptidase-like regulatory domain-containing protein, partial [Chitinophagaceae bacterium]|nr:carboxypeptidase-like regulatory domain-containing protein [Chitinophagaceae bacterium]
MKLLRNIIVIIFYLFPALVYSQKSATLTGIIIDEEHKPINGAAIEIIGNQKGAFSNSTGNFKIEIASNKVVSLIFSFTGYVRVQKNFILNTGETEFVTILLKKDTTTLTEVEVKDDRRRRETGSIQIDPSKTNVNPSPIQGIEQLIKIFVGSNNELTSQYSVRGGSYDENLIYVNDFEVFRPYLIRNGQQEGLSFINPELTSG